MLKIPLGPPLPLTDADLEKLSQVTPADIQAAQKLWRKKAPPRYRKLLDAKDQEIVKNES